MISFQVTEWVDGRGKCPLSPEANSTALMTSGGDFYRAGSVDLANIDHSIFRMDSGKGFRNTLMTDRYNSMWLSQPDFVGSFETARFVYFVFREKAQESCMVGYKHLNLIPSSFHSKRFRSIMMTLAANDSLLNVTNICIFGSPFFKVI